MAYSRHGDSEFIPNSVTNYQFFNGKGDPILFSDLPQFDKSQISSPVYLRGNTADWLHKVHQRVIAWKLDLSSRTGPEVFVSSKNGKLIKLLKPRKIYQGVIRTISITIHMLHFVKWHTNSTVMTLWDHLGRLFDKSQGSPSEDDLLSHLSFIQKFAEQDPTLSKSRILKGLIGKINTATTGDINNNSEDDTFDDVCCICDNGGELLCCEGECMRSFHATKEAGEESKCEGLGFFESQLEDITNFICKNCDLKQQQCFVCGKLGNSDQTKDPEVFKCVNASCGYFYHWKCMSEFTCPYHKCSVCKEPEQKDDFALQFAVCRRCPKSYHRKCLPWLVFEQEDEVIPTRAWEHLLPHNRILIYCMDHKMDDDLGTPLRNHIKFPSCQRNEQVSAIAITHDGSSSDNYDDGSSSRCVMDRYAPRLQETKFCGPGPQFNLGSSVRLFCYDMDGVIRTDLPPYTGPPPGSSCGWITD